VTKEDIIAMARECGIPSSELYHPNLERFVSLVAVAERNRTWTPEHWTEYERGIAAAEREACAKLVEECGWYIAASSIRARGQS
jgi:hypothetical protein